MTEFALKHWSPWPLSVNRKPDDDNRPVFITGVPRCGSSWVGELLGQCSGIRYVYEPFNPTWMPPLRGHIRLFRYFDNSTSVPEVIAATAAKSFDGRQGWKQLARSVRRGYPKVTVRAANRVLVKDPTASLMCEWIAGQFNARVLVVMRHPCGFASSIERLGWMLNCNALVRQHELMDRHLEPFRGLLQSARGDPWLTRGAIWSAVYTVLARQMAAHRDWQLGRYEDLCTDTIGHLQKLAGKIGLSFDENFRHKLESLGNTTSTDPGSTRRNSQNMQDIWQQRMSPGQIDAVMGIVADFGLNEY